MVDSTVGFEFDSLSKPVTSGITLDRAEEQALVAGLRDGAGEAYEELIARFQQPVYSLVFRLMEDSAEANDVVQEVFIKVFRHIESFRGQSSLKTWVYRIAVNEAHNHHRWFKRHRKREVGLDAGEQCSGRSHVDVLPDQGWSPFDIALREETMELIEGALAKLKPVFREAVVLRDVEDLGYEEIAEILEVSLGTVKSRILRGREALRRELEGRLESGRAYPWSPRPAEQD